MSGRFDHPCQSLLAMLVQFVRKLFWCFGLVGFRFIALLDERWKENGDPKTAEKCNEAVSNCCFGFFYLFFVLKLFAVGCLVFCILFLTVCVSDFLKHIYLYKQMFTRRGSTEVHEFEGKFLGLPALFKVTSVIGHVFRWIRSFSYWFVKKTDHLLW